MSWPRQGSQNSLEKPKLMEDQQENKRKSWISWDWGRACQGKLGGCPPPNLFTTRKFYSDFNTVFVTQNRGLSTIAQEQATQWVFPGMDECTLGTP